MIDFFVSHSTKNRDVALHIVKTLEARGIRCWIAPRDIDERAGADWGEEIYKALMNTDAMLLIFSESANDSAHIAREVHLASDNNKKIIPIRTESVVPTGSLAYRLAGLHWLDFLNERDAAIERIVKSRRDREASGSTANAEDSQNRDAEEEIDKESEHATVTFGGVGVRLLVAILSGAAALPASSVFEDSPLDFYLLTPAVFAFGVLVPLISLSASMYALKLLGAIAGSCASWAAAYHSTIWAESKLDMSISMAMVAGSFIGTAIVFVAAYLIFLFRFSSRVFLSAVCAGAIGGVLIAVLYEGGYGSGGHAAWHGSISVALMYSRSVGAVAER